MNTLRARFVAVMVVVLTGSAQASTSWEALFVPPDAANASTVRALPDGGAIVAAWRTVYRFDASGNVVWTRRFDDPLAVYGVALTSDGAIDLVGALDVGGHSIGWLAQLDGDGTVTWARTVDSFGLTFTSAIAPAANGGVFVAGTYRRHDWMSGDAWLLRFDTHGDVVWQQWIGSLQDEEHAIAITPSADGGAIAGIVGHTINGGVGYWLVKVADDGRIGWQQELALLDGHDVVETEGGEVAVVGSRGYPFVDAAALVLHPHGQNLTPVWGRAVGYAPLGASYELVRIAATTDGGVVGLGHRNDPGSGARQIWIVRWSPSGELLWERVYGGPIDHVVAGIDRTPDGGFVLAASDFSQPSGRIWVLKTDSLGRVTSTCALLDRPPTAFGDATASVSRISLAPTSTSIAPQSVPGSTASPSLEITGTCVRP